MAAPYPLVFRPMLLEKVWGGSRLARYSKPLPAGALIGESWELADLPQTSPGGAGGPEAVSVIANGPLAGRTVNEAMRLWGADMLGSASPGPHGRFPLLVKLLDARENLSVQVHPSPAFAAGNPAARLKSECWYVLEAEPGGVIYKGLRPGVSRDDLVRGVGDGSIVGMLDAVPAAAAECHMLPSGTCHALGAGVLVAEVQTPSDTTFRLFDWGRVGRELHVEQALRCILPGPAPLQTRAGDSWSTLARCEHFQIDEGPVGGRELHLPECARGRCVVLMVRSGRVALEAGGSPGGLSLRPGDVALLPASVAARGIRASCAPATRVLTAVPA